MGDVVDAMGGNVSAFDPFGGGTYKTLDSDADERPLRWGPVNLVRA